MVPLHKNNSSYDELQKIWLFIKQKIQRFMFPSSQEGDSLSFNLAYTITRLNKKTRKKAFFFSKTDAQTYHVIR